MNLNNRKYVSVDDLVRTFRYKRSRTVLLSDNSVPHLTRNIWKTRMIRCWCNGSYIEYEDGTVMDRNGMNRGQKLYVFHFWGLRSWWRGKKADLGILNILDVAPIPLVKAGVVHIEMSADEEPKDWLESRYGLIERAEELLPNVGVKDKEIILDLLKAELPPPATAVAKAA